MAWPLELDAFEAVGCLVDKKSTHFEVLTILGSMPRINSGSSVGIRVLSDFSV